MSGDWDLVGGNPAPGDAGHIQLVARRAMDTAGLAADSQVFFEQLTDDVNSCGWEGEAADRFQVAFSPIGPDLGVMARSYESVSAALRTYATELESLQEEASRALARAELAKHRKAMAQDRLDAAARRISDLSRQLKTVRADETFKRTQVTAALWSDPAGGAVAEQQALNRTIATRRSIESALGSAQTEEGQARAQLHAADSELGQARGSIDSVRVERRQAERRAAQAIREAVADELKNKSNIEKARDFAARQWDHMVSIAGYALDRNFSALVNEIRDTFKDWETILKVVAVVAIVVLVVAATVASGGAALGPIAAIAGKLATGAAFAVTLSGKAAVAVAVADAVAVGMMLGTGTVDHRTGRVPGPLQLAVESGEAFVAWGLNKLPGDGGQGKFKRALYPNGRAANGHWYWWKVKVADPGRAIDESFRSRIGYVGRGAASKAGDVGAGEFSGAVFERLRGQRHRFDVGGGIPLAGACYAR